MILVLLSQFSEPGDSIFGHRFCKILVDSGHHLYATTTSTGKELRTEIINAQKLTFSSKGSSTLFEPEYDTDDKPSLTWINTFHEEYFSYLSDLDDVTVIIGIQSETGLTATKLKDSLQCKLVIVSQTNLESTHSGSTFSVNSLVESDPCITLAPNNNSSCQYFIQRVETAVADVQKELPSQTNESFVGNIKYTKGPFGEENKFSDGTKKGIYTIHNYKLIS